MSINNPEADVIAQIERLELEDRELRQHMEQARTPIDRDVIQRQIDEIRQQIEALRKRLP